MKILTFLLKSGVSFLILLLLATIIFFTAGCTSTYAHYKGATFVRGQLGSKVQIGDVSIGTNGVFQMKGYNNEGKVNMELPYGIKITPAAGSAPSP